MFFSVPGVKKIYYSKFFRIFPGCFPDFSRVFFTIFPGFFLRKNGLEYEITSETTIPEITSETTIPGISSETTILGISMFVWGTRKIWAAGPEPDRAPRDQLPSYIAV